jgi:hypothetical protein
MPRTCTVCNHKDVDEINKHLLFGESFRNISKHFGTSESALFRHKESHIPEILAKSKEAEERTNSDNLFKQIGYYEIEAKRYKSLAESDGNIDLALKAVDRAIKCIELYAKVQGLIKEQSINLSLQQTNIYGSTEWLKVGEILAEILAPYPKLKSQVADRLLTLSRGAQL